MTWIIDLLIAGVALVVFVGTGVAWVVMNRIHRQRYRDLADSIAWSIPHRIVAMVNFLAVWVFIVFTFVGLIVGAVS